jgi:hypothetical protein
MKKENNTIFIQIASYRDPELLPTIRDCINKAKYPNNLTFGICWQRDEAESLEEFEQDNRFKIIDVPWNESRGACWARSLVQKLWNGEKYTMQLDSHHRFLQDWDVELIEMMKMTGSKKPIITSYVGMYKPSTNELVNIEPYKMVAQRFNRDGLVLFLPNVIPKWQNLSSPIPARFISGHFYFTLGEHCIECKYDPNLYFHGEEISLSVRSYTSGYDLFHPHKTIIWHEYTREGRTKHWDDFNNENQKIGKIKNQWWETDVLSKKRVRNLFGQEDNQIDSAEYGFGDTRTFSDYEFYAGIHFKNQKVHPETLAGKDPPINDASDWFNIEEKSYNFSLDIPKTDNFKFIYIGIEDINGKQIYRTDLKEYKPKITLEFKSFSEPYKWIYWPVDNNDNWYNRKDTIL